MANDLTGDYDVVAQFSTGAVNRILAAMHRGNRLLHSDTVRVDDLPDFSRIITSVSDAAGFAVTDPAAVGHPGSGQSAVSAGSVAMPPRGSQVPTGEAPSTHVNPLPPGALAASMTVSPTLPGPVARPGILANADASIAALLKQIDHFSYLQGRAQFQLGAPTIQLPQAPSTSGTIHIPTRVRYIPDPNTATLPEFMRGEILITFGVKKVAQAAGTFIGVDLVGPAGNIHFVKSWPPAPLDAIQVTHINRALHNALLTGFQPSVSPLPAGMRNMQFRAWGSANAVGMLINVDGGNGVTNPSPSSVDQIVLGEDDQFALAVAAESIAGPFANAINKQIDPVRDPPLPEVTVHWEAGGFGFTLASYTAHFFPKVHVGKAAVELQDVASGPPGAPGPIAASAAAAAAMAPGTGQILLSIPIHFSCSNDMSGVIEKAARVAGVDIPPANSDFTIYQAFTLSLNGASVGLVQLGSAYVTPAWDGVGDTALNIFNDALAAADGQMQQQINQALTARNLEKFLTKLMNPSPAKSKISKVAVTLHPTPGDPQKAQQEVDPQLTYTSFEITTAGIVLHGALDVPAWPAAHVEFDHNQFTGGPYNALNSWIPGGTVNDYVWVHDGVAQAPEANSFVGAPNAPGQPPATFVCLKLDGTRLSASGPVVPLAVHSSQVCHRVGFPLGALSADIRALAVAPDVAVVGTNQQGRLEIVGHTSPWAPGFGAQGEVANVVVHFPGPESLGNLSFLPQALKQSERADTAANIICVVSHEDLANIRPAPGVVFADDVHGWERLLRVRERPATVVLGTTGQVVWEHHGPVTSQHLAEALRKHLSPGAVHRPHLLTSLLRIGALAPDFLIPSGVGEGVTLQMLERPVALVFWKSSSRPSVEALSVLRQAYAEPGVQGPLIVAIHDGEDTGSENWLATPSVMVMPDPDRAIAAAYGVRIWPTAVFIDETGTVVDIQSGRLSGEPMLRQREQTQ